MNDRSCARPAAKAGRLKAIGGAIRRARLPRSQTELAIAVGKPQASISMWENGQVDLSLERVWAVENALGLPHGALLVEAGYVDLPGLGAPSLIELEPRRTTQVKLAARAATFPEHVRAWLEEYRVLLEAACQLRSTAVDDHALAALLDSRPVTILRCSWQVWTELQLRPDEDPLELMAEQVSARDIEICLFALWGDESPQSVVLRVCKPVPD